MGSSSSLVSVSALPPKSVFVSDFLTEPASVYGYLSVPVSLSLLELVATSHLESISELILVPVCWSKPVPVSLPELFLFLSLCPLLNLFLILNLPQTESPLFNGVNIDAASRAAPEVVGGPCRKAILCNLTIVPWVSPFTH